MAKDAGGTIIALGVVALGYVLYKKGAFNNVITKGGGSPGTQTPTANPRAVGAPTNPFAINIGFGPWNGSSGIQAPWFGLSQPAATEIGAIADQTSELSSQPYILTDSQGNPIPGVT